LSATNHGGDVLPDEKGSAETAHHAHTVLRVRDTNAGDKPDRVCPWCTLKMPRKSVRRNRVTGCPWDAKDPAKV